MARTRDPFTRAQRLSKTVGKEPPGPNPALGWGRLRFSRFLLVPAPLAARMRGSGYALSAVRYIADEFLRKYQMVTQEACETE